MPAPQPSHALAHKTRLLALDELMSQEAKDLIPSLPVEKGWIAPKMHQYQGFWHATWYLQGVIAFQKNFQAQDTDILLITNPKSGTTWLKALVFALVNRLVHYPNPQNHPLITSNPHVLVPFLEINLYADNEDPDLTTLASPRLFATHLPYVSLPYSVEPSSCKVVYLCRNPKDTFVSLWHFANKLRPKSMGAISLEEAFQMFCRGMSMYGPYWDQVLGYWKLSLERPDKLLFIKFEDLKEQPALHLRRLAEFLGYQFSPEEEALGVVDDILKLCSFENLSNLNVNKNGCLPTGAAKSAFFRKGKVGDWKNYLTAEMGEKLDSITQEKWQGSGLKF